MGEDTWPVGNLPGEGSVWAEGGRSRAVER